MLVTFVSQCQKNALKRTRRILDAFANRIGDNVWQTPITEEGLETVRRLLKASATKSTAVSCHRIRTRKHTQLVWVVGRKDAFNELGFVPVNYTEKDMGQFQDNLHWQRLPIIKYASMLAGMFHDLGKANCLFQDKLNPNHKSPNFEPYRHEWVSLRLFEALVFDSNNDRQWLQKLSNWQFDTLSTLTKDGIDSPRPPLKNLPPLAKLIAWLIVSHHKLPIYPNNGTQPPNITEPLLPKFHPDWNSPNCNQAEQKDRIIDNWQFNQNLPLTNPKWLSAICHFASNALKELSLTTLVDPLHDDLYTAHLSRLCLMLADRYFSSLSLEKTQSLGYRHMDYSVYANTYYHDDKKYYKQQLDEHLIGVAKNAAKISEALPKMQQELSGLLQNQALEQKVAPNNPKFTWQNKAQKLAEKIAYETKTCGFFGINMASTGAGKTLANAKIMYQLGQANDKVRFNVALGLRSLTLQTGKVFQQQLNLSDEELAILVGGIATNSLFDQETNLQNTQISEHQTGSESAHHSLHNDIHIDYHGTLKTHALSPWLAQERHTEKLLQPPIVVCTIDHLIGITEGIRGGQQIAPMLRLLTSDLIIDEPDDFDLDDLPALCRLIHFSAMLGRKVLLSTATMPPALTFACFEAYRSGWQYFSKAHLSQSTYIQCAWFDETQNPLQAKLDINKDIKEGEFSKIHKKFVENRIKQLKQITPKTLGEIITIDDTVNYHQKHHNNNDNTNNDYKKSNYEKLANTLFEHIHQLHSHHHINYLNKKISIGLIRMANINPMIATAKALMAKNSPANTKIHYCIYHSRHPLAIRSYIEHCLDKILNRKNNEYLTILQNTINDDTHKNYHHHIFVVIASPVAEVGRDHDYDWAIIEPSSIRSIVQIAGRLLRHRQITPKYPNIYLLNKNIKALNNQSICFNNPGFEQNNTLKLNSHCLNDILNPNDYKIIDSSIKIAMTNSQERKPNENLSDLEQHALLNKLFPTKDNQKNSAAVWWQTQNHWSGEIQRQQRFRQSKKEALCYLWIDNHQPPAFYWYSKEHKAFKSTNHIGLSFVIDDYNAVTLGNHCQFWFDLSPKTIYKKLAKTLNKINLDEISCIYGQIKVNESQELKTLNYHEQLGVYEIISP